MKHLLFPSIPHMSTTCRGANMPRRGESAKHGGQRQQQQQVSCGYHTDIIRVSYGYHTGIIRVSCGYHTDIIQVSYGYHAGIMRISCRYHAGIIRVSYGYHTGIIRVSYGYHTGIIRVSYGYHADIISYGCCERAHGGEILGKTCGLQQWNGSCRVPCHEAGTPGHGPHPGCVPLFRVRAIRGGGGRVDHSEGVGLLS